MSIENLYIQFHIKKKKNKYTKHEIFNKEEEN